jgi:hypothetical protein
MIPCRLWIASTVFRCMVAVATSASADGSTTLGIA